MDTNFSSAVCRVTQCGTLIICSLCRLQGVLQTTLLYIIQYQQEQILKEQLTQRKVLHEQAQQQRGPTRVDCEGPFIAACSLNLMCNFLTWADGLPARLWTNTVPVL